MFDAHAHLSDPRLHGVLDPLILSLRAGGMDHIVLGGVNPDEWAIQEALLKKDPSFVTAVMGIHPWTVRDSSEQDLGIMFSRLKEKLAQLKIIGEVGLDFFLDHSPEQKVKQIFWCEKQLQLAQDEKKGVVLHVVKAHELLLASLRKFPKLRGMIHGFRGSAEMGRRYLALGHVLSLGPRSYAGMPENSYSWLGPDDFMIESDAPQSKVIPENVDDISRDWLDSLNQTAAYLAAGWSLSTDEVWKFSRQNMRRVLDC